VCRKLLLPNVNVRLDAAPTVCSSSELSIKVTVFYDLVESEGKFVWLLTF
jgi:hypothetical protein